MINKECPQCGAKGDFIMYSGDDKTEPYHCVCNMCGLSFDKYHILIEKLATLEHEQWKHWTKMLYKFHRKEVSYDLMSKWVQNWAPYEMLSEDEKDKDRIWARKVIEILKEDGL
jgi:sarcosine oxidase delta subunit